MKSTILIIEDNQELRENAAELLQLSGYNVQTANDGIEGLEKAREQKPDLILCDIMMPELDGYGVLRALNNIDELAGIPFIYLTAKSERDDFRKGMDLGADDYLSKPFAGDELLRIVEGRLKKHEILKKKIGQALEGMDESTNEIRSIEELLNLSTSRTVKKLHARDHIFLEGDSAGFLYFIVSGKIKVYRTSESGKELITNIFQEGGFFGHQALLDDFAHKHSAAAIENTEISLIPKQDFLKLLNSNREVSMKFIRLVSNGMNETEEKLLKLAYNSARKRVAEAILFIAQKYNGKENIGKPFPGFRENISAIAGIAPESVSRNLSDFRDEGLIETNNGEIRIIELKKLQQLRN
jgi:CRP-like cAMP-binding protein